MNKILVVGQTPPPVHGQAIMIQKLLKGNFDPLQLIHVRMAFSRDINDLGKIQARKIFHLFSVIFKIYYNRIVKKTRVLYYPPSGADRIPMYRDIIILCASRWLFKKTIFHFHAGGVSEIWEQLNFLEKFFYRIAYFNSDVAIASSIYSPRDPQFLKAKKCIILPNGIEDNAINISRTNNLNDPVKILFMAFLRETKGEFILLEACKILADRRISFRINVAGEFGSEVIKNKFFNLIDQYQLTSNINHIGVIKGNEKYKLFANTDLFCYPSYYESESFPIVVLEAMQFSLPIITTRWRGIPDMVQEGENGFLVAIKDAEAVASKLQLLISDVELRKEMGKKSREIYLEKFTIDKFYANMKTIFSELIQTEEIHWKNKIIVVGQTPPPVHGQAMMIQKLLEGKYDPIQLIHVRMAFSILMEDLGKIKILKIIHLFTVILKIYYHRITKNIRVLYYPPSGADKIPMYRDIIILCATRWMFKKTIFHFHASGISEIWDQLNLIEKTFFRLAYFNCDLAIVNSVYGPDDSRFLNAKKIAIVPYGIEDHSLNIIRINKQPGFVKILFVGLLKESKGEFILLEACKLLADKKISFSVDVAGKFGSEELKERFFNLIEQYQLNSSINYLGLITGEKKDKVFTNADLFCFPSYYESEAFPVVLLEAMQFSLPILSTNWRGIPVMVQDGKNGYLVEIKDAQAIAEKLQILIENVELRQRMGLESRKCYLEKYTIDKFYDNMKTCFSEL